MGKGSPASKGDTKGPETGSKAEIEVTSRVRLFVFSMPNYFLALEGNVIFFNIKKKASWTQNGNLKCTEQENSYFFFFTADRRLVGWDVPPSWNSKVQTWRQEVLSTKLSWKPKHEGAVRNSRNLREGRALLECCELLSVACVSTRRCTRTGAVASAGISRGAHAQPCTL